jgi:CRISPR-associated exonuclease Cas4
VEVDELLPLSALNHLLYCERRAALIHVDGVWIENAHTTAGTILHERVDSAEETNRPGVRVVRALALRSERLGLYGVADAVELHRRGGREHPYPVEYKRGARRRWENTDVQLAAQAMALEEMTGVPVPEGAVFHGKTQRRRVVRIDDALRAETMAAAARLHELVRERRVPLPVLKPQCEGCSIRPACNPEATLRAGSLSRAVRAALGDPGEERP